MTYSRCTSVIMMNLKSQIQGHSSGCSLGANNHDCLSGCLFIQSLIFCSPHPLCPVHRVRKLQELQLWRKFHHTSPSPSQPSVQGHLKLQLLSRSCWLICSSYQPPEYGSLENIKLIKKKNQENNLRAT